jgi:hypothetical protein
MPTRYMITFEGLDYIKDTQDYMCFHYVVCTCLDASKAIVMATQVHTTKHPASHIYEVVQLVKLDGTEALDTDIVDRMEY